MLLKLYSTVKSCGVHSGVFFFIIFILKTHTKEKIQF